MERVCAQHLTCWLLMAGKSFSILFLLVVVSSKIHHPLARDREEELQTIGIYNIKKIFSVIILIFKTFFFNSLKNLEDSQDNELFLIDFIWIGNVLSVLSIDFKTATNS